MFLASAWGAPLLAIQGFFLLPLLGSVLLGGGHPSGEALGFLMALGFSTSNGLLGAAATIARLRVKRAPLLFIALVINLAFVVCPLFIGL